MSGDSIDLPGLEGKDRSELMTIAQTLGGKPSSRARKADLVSMILELAGVEDRSGGSGETHDVMPAAAKSPIPTLPLGGGVDAVGTDAAGEEVDAGPRDDDGSSAEDADDADTDGAAADGAAEGTPAEGTTAKATGRGRRNANSNGHGKDQGSPQSRTESAADSDNGSGTEGGGTQTSGTQTSGTETAGTEAGGIESDADANAEGEGRGRRRRRGRNRDRADENDAGAQWDGEPISVSGTLDLRDEGYGFLRVNGVLPSRDDVYVSVKQTRQFGLRRGDWIAGTSRPANRSEKNPALLRIDAVNGRDPESARERPRFEELVPLFPNEMLNLERADHPYDITARIIDLLAPIGKGQRGLIVAPPKSGKTTVMKSIAQAIEENHPEVELIVLLVDERPEEVTDMRRSINGEVVASTFDRPPEEHTQVTELVVERAKRMVEDGQDVVMLVDGITRLARAYNLAAPTGGRIMSGGLDTGALYPPKRFFGAARNVEDGGSLTILATALVDTNSRMDEIIFEEFKGTGNMELRLDREAAERRVYPAVDVAGSSTRHEELLIDPERLGQIWKLRRVIAALAESGDEGAGLDLIIERMRKFPTNDSFLAEIAKAPAVR